MRNAIKISTGDQVITVTGRRYWEALAAAEASGMTVAEYVHSMLGMTVDQMINARIGLAVDEHITRLHALNYSDPEIARALDRSVVSVTRDRKRLGLPSRSRKATDYRPL